MINDQRLDQFYSLKQDLATLPVNIRLFEEHDFSWLLAMIENSEIAAKEQPNLDLAVDGTSSVGCVWMIGRSLHVILTPVVHTLTRPRICCIRNGYQASVTSPHS